MRTIDEEILGSGNGNLHITNFFVAVDTGEQKLHALLDRDGWVDLQLIVTEVCAEHGWV